MTTLPQGARGAAQMVYRGLPCNPAGTETSGVYGTLEQVAARLQEFVSMGATHLLLNPVADHAEQLEACAEVIRRAA